MKRTVYFPELFKEIGEAKTRKEKIEILRKYKDVKGMMELLYLCYEPSVEWYITRRELDNLHYDKMDIPDYDLAPTTLFVLARRQLANYTNLRVPPLKKYKIIRCIQTDFSSLHPDEVELFKQIVDGRIQQKGLTENLVREAFPGLLKELPKEVPPPTKARDSKFTQKSEPLVVEDGNTTQKKTTRKSKTKTTQKKTTRKTIPRKTTTRKKKVTKKETK